MNKIDEFIVAVCGTDPLDAFGSMRAMSRKISSEKLDGYNYNGYLDLYEEGDKLFRERIKSSFKTQD